MRFRQILKISALLLLCISIETPAQSKTGSIQGYALDQNGAIVPGVTIIATVAKHPNKKAKELTTYTGDGGKFEFANLEPGEYRLTAKFSWTEFVPESLVTVLAGKISTASLQLKPFSTRCLRKNGATALKIKEDDQAEIVGNMLRLSGERIAGALMEKDNSEKPILSKRNIKSAWLEKTTKKRFDLMSQEDIQLRADTKKDFTYLVFSDLSVKGSCVSVSLDYVWAVGKKSPVVYLDGGGVTYEFQKVDGKWVGKFVTSWIS